MGIPVDYQNCIVICNSVVDANFSENSNPTKKNSYKS